MAELNEVYQQLVDAIVAGALAMVGAGSSARLGYPTWLALVNSLAEEASKKSMDSLDATHRSLDVLVRAEKYSQILGAAEVGRIIGDVFAPRTVPFDNFHEALVSIPFHHILMTNYEFVLENAQTKVSGSNSFKSFDFHETEKRRDFLHALGNSHAKRRFVHLHGSSRNPEKIVLSLSSYREHYLLAPEISAALHTIFTLRPVVFIGFGLSDSYFMSLLDSLIAYLGGSSPRHFAILPSNGADSDDVRKVDLETRFGVTPLFYDPADNHKALHELLARLSRDTNKSLGMKRSAELLPLVNTLLPKMLASGRIEATERELYDHLPVLDRTASAATGAASNIESTTALAERVPLDNEIDEVMKLVKDGKAAIALALLNSILHRTGAILTERIKYRLHANQGTCHLAMGDTATAAEQYLVAFSLRPSSKDARALEALAYLLRHDSANAYTKAAALCRDEPDFPKAHALRVRTLPGAADHRAARKTVPRPLRRDPEVAAALANLAREAGDLKRQERLFRIAVHSAPDWGDAWICLGASILVQERAAAEVDFDQGLVPAHPNRVTKALDAFTIGIEKLHGDLSPQQKSIAFFNRASARMLLQDRTGASEDLRAARLLRPDEAEVVARIAWEYEKQDDVIGGIKVLEEFRRAAEHSETAFVFALLLCRRQGVGDLQAAENLLVPWIEPLVRSSTETRHKSRMIRHAGSLADTLRLLSDVYLRLGQRDKAIKLYRSVPIDALPDGLADAHIARLTLEPHQDATIAGAQTLLHSAVARIMANGDWFDKHEVSVIAHQLGDEQLEFILLRDITTTRRFNSITLRLLRVAFRMKEEAFILEFCAALRANNIWERDAIGLEINTLIRCHESQVVVKLLQEWLTRHPEDSEIRLSLSLVGIRLGRLDLVELDASKLPTLNDFDAPEEAAALMEVLRYGPDPTAAVHFGYALWRRFPDSPGAQHALSMAIFHPGERKPALTHPESVDTLSAVTVRGHADQQTQVVVIEAGTNPRPTLFEYSPDHALSKALRGARVGQEVNDPTTGTRLTIIAIQNKFVYRAQQFLATFAQAFPDTPLMRQFHIRNDVVPGTHPKIVLGEMWELLEADARERERWLNLYQNVAIPISRLAQLSNRSVVETVLHVADQDELGVLVSSGLQLEWQQALLVLKSPTAVVLDGTAIAVLFMLGLYEKLPSFPFRCIVPETAMGELRQWRSHYEAEGLTGYMGVQDGRLSLSEISTEQRLRILQQIDTLISTLSAHCEIVGGKARLKLPPELREKLPDTYGLVSIDAICIAKDRNLPLWTEDFLTWAHVAAKVDVPRIWSQPVLEVLRTSVPSLSTAAKAGVIKLFLAGWAAMRLSIPVVIELLEQGRWNPQNRIAKRVLSYLTFFGGQGESNCEVSRVLVIAIWRRCPSERTAKVMIEAILDAIGRAVSGPRIARPIYCSHGMLTKLRGPKRRRLKGMLRRWRMRSQ